MTEFTTKPAPPEEPKPETAIEPTVYVVCARCNQPKTTDKFYSAPTTKTGFNKHCKQCIKEIRDIQAENLKKSTEEDRLEFVTEQIAMRTVAPRPEGDWAGRDRLLKATMKRYAVEYEEADRLVKLATSRLFDERPDNPPRIERRMMLQRLSRVRESILKELERKSIIMDYEIVSSLDSQGKPKTGVDGKPIQYKVPKKMKTIRQADASLVKAYIDIERLHAELCGLDEAGRRDNIIGDVMAAFHGLATSDVEGSIEYKKGAGSLASQVRQSLLPVHKETSQKRPKLIEATVSDARTREK